MARAMYAERRMRHTAASEAAAAGCHAEPDVSCQPALSPSPRLHTTPA